MDLRNMNLRNKIVKCLVLLKCAACGFCAAKAIPLYIFSLV